MDGMKRIFIFIVYLCILLLPLNAEILSLEECIKISLSNNPTIKKYKYLINQYEYKIKHTLSSFYPTLTLSGSYTHKSTGTTIANEPDSYSISLNLNQLIFNGLTRVYNYKISKLDKRVIVQNYNDAIRNLIYSIKEKYFKVLLYRSQIKVLKKIIERRKEDLAIIKLKYDAGKENSASVLEMESDLKQAEYDLLDKKENLELLKISLSLLMGKEKDYNFMISEYRDNFPEFDKKTVVEKAKKLSPEINTARLQLQIEKYKLNSTKGEYFPSVDFTTSYKLNDEKFFPENKSWSIGLSISFPLFSGFSTPYAIKEIKSKIKSREEELKEIENNIKIKLYELLTKYNLLKKKREVIQLRYSSTYENYRLYRLKYKQGKISYMWLRQKENELSKLELDKEQIIYNIRTTLAEIEKYIKGAKN